jgi:hypothetical protein
MAYGGFEKDREVLKYKCPAKAYNQNFIVLPFENTLYRMFIDEIKGTKQIAQEDVCLTSAIMAVTIFV